MTAVSCLNNLHRLFPIWKQGREIPHAQKYMSFQAERVEAAATNTSPSMTTEQRGRWRLWKSPHTAHRMPGAAATPRVFLPVGTWRLAFRRWPSFFLRGRDD